MLERLRDDFVQRLKDGAFEITSFQESLGCEGVKGLDSKVRSPHLTRHHGVLTLVTDRGRRFLRH